MSRPLAEGRDTGKTLVISVRFTREELERIQRVAQAQDRSVNKVIRRLVIRGLASEEGST